MSDDYDLDDLPCPACGHWPTRSRNCPNCDEGWIDRYEEDPLWYSPGEEEMCQECSGTGLQRWCPECGADYWQAARRRVFKRRARGRGRDENNLSGL